MPHLFYFFYYAAAAALIPYLTLYYQTLGLGGASIGLLAGLPSLVSLGAAPLWGALADATRQHKIVLLATISGALFSSQLLGLAAGLTALTLLVLCFSLFSSPVMALVDHSVIEQLGTRRSAYGKIRLWGAVGWGIAAPVAGWLIDRWGPAWSFHAYFLLLGLGLLAATRLEILPGSQSQNFLSGLRQLLRGSDSSGWLSFLSLVFLCGLSMSVISSYLFLRLEELGANRTLMGVSLAFATLSELPAMYYADRLIHRLGEYNLLLIGLALYGVRGLVLAWLPLPGLVLPIQLMHGLTFSLTWVAGVAYAGRLAPPGLGATAQGLFTGIYLGLGAASGSFLGGLLFQSFGLPALFLAQGLVAGLASLLFASQLRRGSVFPG